jgi:hypothetical protein
VREKKREREKVQKRSEKRSASGKRTPRPAGRNHAPSRVRPIGAFSHARRLHALLTCAPPSLCSRRLHTLIAPPPPSAHVHASVRPLLACTSPPVPSARESSLLATKERTPPLLVPVRVVPARGEEEVATRKDAARPPLPALLGCRLPCMLLFLSSVIFAIRLLEITSWRFVDANIIILLISATRIVLLFPTDENNSTAD